jgi:hypothetical protein
MYAGGIRPYVHFDICRNVLFLKSHHPIPWRYRCHDPLLHSLYWRIVRNFFAAPGSPTASGTSRSSRSASTSTRSAAARSATPASCSSSVTWSCRKEAPDTGTTSSTPDQVGPVTKMLGKVLNSVGKKNILILVVNFPSQEYCNRNWETCGFYFIAVSKCRCRLRVHTMTWFLFFGGGGSDPLCLCSSSALHFFQLFFSDPPPC